MVTMPWADRFMSSFDPTLDPKPVVVRRLEVLTGAGGRRRWSADDKARIVEETLAPGATVSEVARRHDIRPQQLFGWRREMRIADPEPPPSFVPAVVEEPERVDRARPRSARTGRGDIELEFEGVVVRVRRGAEAKTVAAVIKALKAAR
jgi:transposase